MKEVNIRICVNGEKQAIIEKVEGFEGLVGLEREYMIIGMLDNLKNHHLNKIKTLLEETRKI